MMQEDKILSEQKSVLKPESKRFYTVWIILGVFVIIGILFSGFFTIKVLVRGKHNDDSKPATTQQIKSHKIQSTLHKNMESHNEQKQHNLNPQLNQKFHHLKFNYL